MKCSLNGIVEIAIPGDRYCFWLPFWVAFFSPVSRKEPKRSNKNDELVSSLNQHVICQRVP